MKTYSERMLECGWILHKNGETSWSLRSPLGFTANWTNTSPLPSDLLREIDAVEQAVHDGKISRFLGTALRLQPPLPEEGSPAAQRLAKEHIAKGHAVLRLRANRDPAGDEILLNHGAWRVETLLPPWTPPQRHSKAGFNVLMCEHLLDTLPRLDRASLLRTLLSITPPGEGVVYFTVTKMSGLPRDWLRVPYEDGYQVKYGLNLCFIKPYNEAMLCRELSETLHGNVERAWIQHHELAYTWRPHV